MTHSKMSLAAALLLTIVAETGLGNTPPNLILCMGDDHGWEETGYQGHPFIQTPVLDDMAASGLRLDRFYAAHPSCSPTRGSVLTGRHPNRYGTFAPGYSLRPEEITIARQLKEAGYACGHFGKWHVGTVKAGSPTNPGAMGFDEWLSHDNFFELNPPFSRNGGAPEVFEGESSAVVVDEAAKFIRRAVAEEKPFFVVLWFGSPHEPYQGLPEDLALYDDLPADLENRTVRLTSNETGRPVRRPLRAVLRERYAEITAMDRAMGKLRDFLDGQGVREDTLLWYCGDNGTPPSGVGPYAPLRGRKGQFFEGGIRVPGIIEWPARIREGRVSTVPAVTSDMLPTACALAGVPLPDRPLDGIDLVALIDGTLTQRPKPIFFWGIDTQRIRARNPEPYVDPKWQEGTTPLVKLMGGIATRNFRNHRYPEIVEADYGGERVAMDGDWKLLVRERKGAAPERMLFDLGNDPAEETDLATEEPGVVKELETQLRAWQTSVLTSLTGADYR